MDYKLNLPKKREIESKAGFMKRLLAFILDIIIIRLVILTPFEGYFKKIPYFSDFNSTYAYFLENQAVINELYYLVAIISLLSLLYFALLEWKLGQTLGMMLMRIHVKPIPISFFKAIVRNMFVIPFFPFIILWPIDLFMMLFTKEGQRLEERLTGTYCIEKNIY